MIYEAGKPAVSIHAYSRRSAGSRATTELRFGFVARDFVNEERRAEELLVVSRRAGKSVGARASRVRRGHPHASAPRGRATPIRALDVNAVGRDHELVGRCSLLQEEKGPFTTVS